ncbi:MAG: hypothetical protein ACOCXQ_03350 [Patescibacteria group bacterium]
MRQQMILLGMITAICLILTSFFFVPSVSAQERYAECDVCGYCQGMDSAPGAWKSCVKCMYDLENIQPEDKKTLQIITDPSSPNYNRQVQPVQGRYHTMIGCLNTSLNSFEEDAAAGNVVNFLLERIIFNIAGAIAFLYLIYGAFIIMTAKGNQVQLSRGKNMIVGSVVGLIFLFSLGLILSLIGEGLLRIPGFSTGSSE